MTVYHISNQQSKQFKGGMENWKPKGPSDEIGEEGFEILKKTKFVITIMYQILSFFV